jgi:peroxiredoxin family protein
MKLGIFINTDKHLSDVIGIAKAAVAKGHEVAMFNMDDGLKLITKPAFSDICKLKGISTCYCDHSAKGMNIAKEGIPVEVICGSQYNNAVMVDASDRIIVL